MMTEQEKTQKALEYIGKLAEGIDPITDKPVADGSVYDNVRLCRCFFYVAEILKRVVANGGEVGKIRKNDFLFDAEMLKGVKPSDESVTVNKFIDHIHGQIGFNNGKIPFKAITGWLLRKGLLIERGTPDGPKRIASPTGIELGMTNIDTQGAYGNYTAVYYGRNVQQYILDNMQEILSR